MSLDSHLWTAGRPLPLRQTYHDIVLDTPTKDNFVPQKLASECCVHLVSLATFLQSTAGLHLMLGEYPSYIRTCIAAVSSFIVHSATKDETHSGHRRGPKRSVASCLVEAFSLPGPVVKDIMVISPLVPWLDCFPLWCPRTTLIATLSLLIY